MFIPKNFKFKKQQKGKNFSKINNYKTKVEPYRVKLYAISFGQLKSNHFKAIKLTINKIIKKRGRVTFNIHPQTPISKKPIEVRMGKGKGNVNHWVYKVRPGTPICFIESEFKSLAIKALTYIRIRLPIKTKIN